MLKHSISHFPPSSGERIIIIKIITIKYSTHSSINSSGSLFSIKFGFSQLLSILIYMENFLFESTRDSLFYTRTFIIYKCVYESSHRTVFMRKLWRKAQRNFRTFVELRNKLCTFLSFSIYGESFVDIKFTVVFLDRDIYCILICVDSNNNTIIQICQVNTPPFSSYHPKSRVVVNVFVLPIERNVNKIYFPED